jgi:AcrR family transcriptional regulator
MARPIQADAEATRLRILAEASTLFALHGQGGTTMRQIAARAAVSMATVHHYFGGKAELYRACIDATVDEIHGFRQQVEPTLSTAENITHGIEVVVRKSYRFCREHRFALRLLTRTIVDEGELDAAPRDNVLLPYLDRGAALLAPLLDQPLNKVRLALLSINYMMVRFALNSAPELALITKVSEPNGETPESTIENYLVDAACDLLGLAR